MKKIFTIISCIILTGNVLLAQGPRMITSGIIEFEKTVNMHAITRGQLGNPPEEYRLQEIAEFKKTTPQFKTFKSTLIFADNKSLFSPTPIGEYPNLYRNPMGMQLNTVYADLNTNSLIAQKEIYGDLFMVKDSTRKITWRLTGETQEIAGYTCRRANGIILDSVYLVAFYTDKIWFSGGPESFTGLPGMILKLAIPHENIIWTATKVTDQAVAPAAIIPPKKGTSITPKALREKLKEHMQNWGPVGDYELKAFML